MKAVNEFWKSFILDVWQGHASADKQTCIYIYIMKNNITGATSFFIYYNRGSILELLLVNRTQAVDRKFNINERRTLVWHFTAEYKYHISVGFRSSRQWVGKFRSFIFLSKLQQELFQDDLHTNFKLRIFLKMFSPLNPLKC